MKKIEKWFINNKLYLICAIIYFIMCLFMYIKFSHLTFAIVSVVLFVYLMINIYIIKNKKISIEKMFLIMAIPLGLFMLFAIPMGNIPDERSHFSRAYEISELHLLSDTSEDNRTSGRVLPIELYEMNGFNYTYQETMDKLMANSNERKYVAFSNTSLYSFVCYIPQIIGIGIGKVFHLPIYIQGYLGRLTNFICWIILVFLAIKVIPFGKKILFFISLFPITLQEAASLSPDALTFGAAQLLFSFVMYKIFSNNKMTKFDYIAISLLCIITSLVKIVYLPLCLLICLIPKNKFKSSKQKWIFIISLAVFVVALNLVWLHFANQYLVYAMYDTNLQKEFILSNPLTFILIIFRTVYYSGQAIVEGMFGHFLESFTVGMPYITVYLNMIIFSIMCINMSNEKVEISKTTKYLIIFILFSIFMLIHASLYIQWTKPNAGMIDGIQGRYYLPVLMLIPVLFAKNKIQKNKKVNNTDEKNTFVYSYMVLQNILALILIMTTHM